MQRIGAVQRIPGSTNHLETHRQFRRQFEQLVDVAEAVGPRRDAIFEYKERTAGAGAGENRGTNRRQALLAAAAHDPHAGHLHHQLVYKENQQLLTHLRVNLKNNGKRPPRP